MASQKPVTARTVKIGCKLPAGINICLESPEDISGNRYRKYQHLKGIYHDHMSRAIGCGFTLLDGNFWDEWISLPQNKNFGPVVRGLIFVVPTGADNEREAGKRLNIRREFAPLDPANPAPEIKFNGQPVVGMPANEAPQ